MDPSFKDAWPKQTTQSHQALAPNQGDEEADWHVAALKMFEYNATLLFWLDFDVAFLSKKSSRFSILQSQHPGTYTIHLICVKTGSLSNCSSITMLLLYMKLNCLTAKMSTVFIIYFFHQVHLLLKDLGCITVKERQIRYLSGSNIFLPSPNYSWPFYYFFGTFYGSNNQCGNELLTTNILHIEAVV